MALDQTEEREYAAFLRELLDGGHLAGDNVAEGIVRQVAAQGISSLSSAQERVLAGPAIARFIHERCEICAQKIPWSEMYEALETGICQAHREA